jgi:hypothetical protein
MGYKNIMNLPVFPDTGCQAINPETLAGYTRKFPTFSGFFIHERLREPVDDSGSRP